MPRPPLGSIRSCLSGHDYDRGTERLMGSSGGGWPLLHVNETVGWVAGPLAGSTVICVFSSLAAGGRKAV